ncbi:DASH complex subunit Dad2 [Paraphaeosphaeria minitans]|uniref:DASH complex subunit DAD2 n=1 Tax=Paraphaeosphaeria minitans TaxID=565426 RepID=A0A9P6KTV5_9PLEO|nr:DASH complex subunit Dad2 [Paraphaeosphaeria minitans]
MAYPARGLPSHIRSQSNSLGGSQPSGQSPVLLARIAEKKAELASLKDLQILSAGLADQMQTLAEKLSTLSDGTEGPSSSIPPPTPRTVAAVLSNWHNVLRAINMASAKLPKPKEDDDAEKTEAEPPLPRTLVRIPTQHAPAVLPQPTLDD